MPEYYVLSRYSKETDVGPHNKKCKVVNADTPRLAKVEYIRAHGKRLKVTDPETLEVRYASGAHEGALTVSKKSLMKTTTYDDSQFRRTALVYDGKGNETVDVLRADGTRLCQINFFYDAEKAHLIVDTIDVDDRFSQRKAVVFPNRGGANVHVKAGQLVSADFSQEANDE